MRRRTSYILHADPIARPRPVDRAPDSVGRIQILATGRLGAHSPLDENGKRANVGVHNREVDAQRALQEHRARAKFAKSGVRDRPAKKGSP